MNFLSLESEAFGLDISDLSLKIIKLKKRGRFFRLASWGEAEIKPGIIQEGEIKDPEALAGIIRQGLVKVKGEKIRTKNVAVSLPEKKAFLEVIQMPKMAYEDLKTAVPFEAENYIPLPLEKVYLDFQKVRPVLNHLDHLDILIAAIPRETVGPYISSLKKAGLSARALEVESQSISRALIKNGLSPFPVLIVDFGRSRASFIIFSGYSLRFTSSVPISSQRLTEAISQSLNLDLKEAEQRKLEQGLDSKEISPAMLPILEKMVEQIRKYLNYYQSHQSHEHLLRDSKEIREIILCGRGANLKGLAEFSSRELKIPTKIANPWINILAGQPKEVLGLSFEDSLGYTSALGLALRGIQN